MGKVGRRDTGRASGHAKDFHLYPKEGKAVLNGFKFVD